MTRTLFLLLLGCLAAPATLHAQSTNSSANQSAAAPPMAPTPPCGGTVYPPYGEVDGKPLYTTWRDSDLLKMGWRPPACLGWQGDSRLVAAMAARFHGASTLDAVAAPLAAVSHYPDIKFWAITKRDWRPIAQEAWAVDGPQAATRVPDPPIGALQPGHDFYYAEEAEMAGRAVYKIHVQEHTADRLVFETENVSPIKIAIMTVFEPGALQVATFIDRIDANSWGLYEITRASLQSSSMVSGYRSSYLNRLEAIRRLLAGVPTDRDPPIAPW